MSEKAIIMGMTISESVDFERLTQCCASAVRCIIGHLISTTPLIPTAGGVLVV